MAVRAVFLAQRYIMLEVIDSAEDYNIVRLSVHLLEPFDEGIVPVLADGDARPADTLVPHLLERYEPLEGLGPGDALPS